MPLSVVLAAAAVAASIPLLWWAVSGARSSQAKTVDPRVIAGGAGAVDLRTAVLERSAHDRAVAPLGGMLVRLARRLTPVGRIEALDDRITLAGRPAAWPIERVLITKLVLGGACAGVGALAFTANRTGLWLLVWIAMTVIGYFTPDLLLYSRGMERRDAIDKAMPDTLDQMTITVEAGLGFESAMARAGRTGHGPLAQEILRTMQEIQIGVPRVKALRNLADRTDSDELRHFVHAVVQAEQYGIPIADVLRTQAVEQRTKRRQRAEEHAMKMPVKIVFPLILCILPSLFIVILGPAVIQITRTLLGDGGAFG